jgi:hypothetical protein
VRVIERKPVWTIKEKDIFKERERERERERESE